MTTGPGPLQGLRVADLATVLAAPSAARYPADVGAEVIKVERPDGGDTTRSMGWRDSDGVIENFRPGTLERLGLGPDVLLARRPRWWCAASRASGRAAPMRTAPGSRPLPRR